MKLSELTEICKDSLEKYGDRDVLVDVEARHFEYHLARINGAGMTLCADDYKDDPELLDCTQLGLFLINVD